jgi:hypothetical protein
LAPIFAAALTYVGTVEIRGGWHLGNTYALLQNKPLQALRANWAAYEANPHDGAIRRQLQLTLLRAVHAYWPKVRLEAHAQDLFYRIAASAGPDYPASLTTRIEILINFGRAEEAKPLIARLNKLHPKQTEKLRIGVIR